MRLFCIAFLALAVLAAKTHPELSIEPNPVMQGQTVDFVGTGFDPGLDVTIYYAGPQNGTAIGVADGSGDFDIPLSTAGLPTGSYNIEAAQQRHGRLINITLGTLEVTP